MKNQLKYSLGLLFALALCASAATVDGLKIHSAVTGRGPKTVILVHGWTCDSTSWSEQVPALSKDYRVVTLDLPGHGMSDSPKDGKFSMDLFARAVEHHGDHHCDLTSDDPNHRIRIRRSHR